MKHHDEELLNGAIQALKNAEPGPEAIANSVERVADRLGIAMQQDVAAEAIRSCEDVQRSLGAYRAGNLSDTRAMLLEAHLRDCALCLHRFRSEPGHAGVDWSTPRVGKQSQPGKSTRAAVLRPWTYGWALGGAFALIATSFFVYKAYWEVPPGVRAEVQSIDGSAWLISDQGSRQLAPGAGLHEGERLRTAGGSHAVLRLADGSTVEVNERSLVNVGARGHNMTVSLDNGAVIVQAAKRNTGHLYVRTPDCRVAVTGTLFSVDAGIKGSRVGVLRGNVHVVHAGIESVLEPGDQLSTNENLSPEPLETQVAWSQDREKYIGLAAQLALLRHRIGEIPLPQPRYSSDLLERVPADTLLYVSIPNLGDFLSQANTIFHDQLKQSPQLQEWWNHGHGNNAEELDSLVEKLQQMSRYFGDEVVIVSVKQGDHPGFAVLADLNKGGLDDFLKQQFPDTVAKGGITVFDQHALIAATETSKMQHGGYALMREREAIFSNSIDTLKTVNAQLNAGSSGFASQEFGKQIAAAYSRGAGIILAADLHGVLNQQGGRIHMPHSGNTAMENSGLEGVQYLIAEHRELNGTPQNHLNLQFTGTRQRVASWLAEPAPIESLDFVSPNASFAVAALSKDPKSIADDLLAIGSGNHPSRESDMSETAKQVETIVRDELVPNLGGDFLFSLDGPVLPTPSWKVVVEVHDSDRVEDAFEHLVKLFDDQPHGDDFHQIAIEPSQAGGERFYAVHDLTSDTVRAYYTFADGFMIVAPTRALLMQALRTHSSGDTLARSAAFKALLPKDESENCSAVAYQNLSPVISPLLSQMTGETANALRALAEDSKPTAACAWGRESRIEAGSDSHLFGFDFLTLGTLINSRNKSVVADVTD